MVHVYGPFPNNQNNNNKRKKWDNVIAELVTIASYQLISFLFDSHFSSPQYIKITKRYIQNLQKKKTVYRLYVYYDM